MSSGFVVGVPAHSSTPKTEYGKKVEKLQPRKMASQMEGNVIGLIHFFSFFFLFSFFFFFVVSCLERIQFS